MQIPREEMTEWIAFWQLEPFGSSFEEYRAALVASVLAEVNRNHKKRGRPFSPSEFMTDWDKATGEKKGEQSAESMFAFVQQVQAAIEVRAGKRDPLDLSGAEPPVLYDSRGNPLPRTVDGSGSGRL